VEAGAEIDFQITTPFPGIQFSREPLFQIRNLPPNPRNMRHRQIAFAPKAFLPLFKGNLDLRSFKVPGRRATPKQFFYNKYG
jgi:hypothetical protein